MRLRALLAAALAHRAAAALKLYSSKGPRSMANAISALRVRVDATRSQVKELAARSESANALLSSLKMRKADADLEGALIVSADQAAAVKAAQEEDAEEDVDSMLGEDPLMNELR